jgi:hypothetical protein
MWHMDDILIDVIIFQIKNIFRIPNGFLMSTKYFIELQNIFSKFGCSFAFAQRSISWSISRIISSKLHVMTLLQKHDFNWLKLGLKPA